MWKDTLITKLDHAEDRREWRAIHIKERYIQIAPQKSKPSFKF